MFDFKYSDQEYFTFLSIMTKLFRCNNVFELSVQLRKQAKDYLGARFFFTQDRLRMSREAITGFFLLLMKRSIKFRPKLLLNILNPDML